MEDRKLIEAAAKACGLPECGWMGPAFMYVKDNRFTDWSPLTDDGDAFRLAVKLAIDIKVRNGATWWDRTVADCFTQWNYEPHGADPYAATRRAIVRAAAAMCPREPHNDVAERPGTQ